MKPLIQCMVAAIQGAFQSRHVLLLMAMSWTWALAPRPAEAGDHSSSARPWVLRAALGAGYTYEQFEGDDDNARSSGKGSALAWDLAVGRRFSRWATLHGTAFGSVVPRATMAAVRRPEADSSGRLGFYALGGGATLSAAWGGFLSHSLALAMIQIDGLEPRTPAYGVASQVLLGVSRPLNARLGLGVALQAAGVLGFETWSLGHGACLLSLTYE